MSRTTLRAVAAVLALCVFFVDVLTPLEGAVAVLYVVVVLVAARTSSRRDILAAAIGGCALTVAAYIALHGGDHVGSPTLRAFVSLAAILITALLALQNLRTYEALATSERRYRRMFDASRIGVVEEDWSAVRAELDALPGAARADLDAHLAADPGLVARARRHARIKDVNPAFLAMVGPGSSGRAPGAVNEVLSPTDCTFAGALAAFARGEAFFEGETALLRCDGSSLPALFALTFPTIDDGNDNVLAFVVDITERRDAHDALFLAQTELAHAARVATLGELTASIAHEVNQPLMAVVTSGEAGLRWLRRDPPDLGEVEKVIIRIVAEGRRAGEVVTRIRSFLRKAPDNPSDLSVAALVEAAVALVERELTRERIALSLVVEPDLPQVTGDRIRLEQILVNLIVNAAQALAGVAESRSVTVTASLRDASTIAIAVADNGPGIAVSDLARLFDPFFTTKPQGMGWALRFAGTHRGAYGGELFGRERAWPRRDIQAHTAGKARHDVTTMRQIRARSLQPVTIRAAHRACCR